MRLRKWNVRTGGYEPYDIPGEWNVRYFSEDMSETVNCARCGRKMKYGDGFKSRLIHTEMGYGYCVCDDCFFGAEWEEEKGKL